MASFNWRRFAFCIAIFRATNHSMHVLAAWKLCSLFSFLLQVVNVMNVVEPFFEDTSYAISHIPCFVFLFTFLSRFCCCILILFVSFVYCGSDSKLQTLCLWPLLFRYLSRNFEAEHKRTHNHLLAQQLQVLRISCLFLLQKSLFFATYIYTYTYIYIAA